MSCIRKHWIIKKNIRYLDWLEASKTLISVFRVSDLRAFFKFTWMSPETFDLLLEKVGSKIVLCKRVQQPILERERLKIVIHCLVTGDFTRDFISSSSWLFRISEAATHNIDNIGMPRDSGTFRAYSFWTGFAKYVEESWSRIWRSIALYSCDWSFRWKTRSDRGENSVKLYNIRFKVF